MTVASDCCEIEPAAPDDSSGNERDLSRVAGILIGIALRIVHHADEEPSDDHHGGLRARLDRGPG